MFKNFVSGSFKAVCVCLAGCGLGFSAAAQAVSFDQIRENCANTTVEPTHLSASAYPEGSPAQIPQGPDLTKAWWMLLTRVTNATEVAHRCVAFELAAAQSLRERKTTEAGIFKRAARVSLLTLRDQASAEIQDILRAGRASAVSNDVIPECAVPLEVGGYVVQLPNSGQIIANAGGFQVELPLFEVHLPVNDTWRTAADESIALRTAKSEPKDVQFTVRYPSHSETYELTPSELRITISADAPRIRIRSIHRSLKFEGAAWREIDGGFECDFVALPARAVLLKPDPRR